jgi:toxin-antitoxin system PIN domain toxin
VIALLDVNVLIALFDPAHVHHEAAHAWFEANGKSLWATCALTENAFVRVLSNPTYPGRGTTMADAVSRLRAFCSAHQHVFWPDSVSLLDGKRFRWNHVQGHRQITDVYLLALVVSRQGRLATFDSTISVRAVEGAKAQNLEVIAV